MKAELRIRVWALTEPRTFDIKIQFKDLLGDMAIYTINKVVALREMSTAQLIRQAIDTAINWIEESTLVIEVDAQVLCDIPMPVNERLSESIDRLRDVCRYVSHPSPAFLPGKEES